MADFRPPVDSDRRPPLGVQGPFPRCALVDPIERRWLHYAFVSRDGQLGMVANAAWLGPHQPGDATRYTTILLLHERGRPWVASQFNADISAPPWSAFRLPTIPGTQGAAGRLRIASTSGAPAVDLQLQRTAQRMRGKLEAAESYAELAVERGRRALATAVRADGSRRARPDGR